MVRISEASRITGVAVDTLRFWEDEGLLDDVPRDSAGRRDYGEDDLGWVRFVQRMRATGMSTRDVATYARMVREGEGTIGDRRALLERHREVVVAALDELREVRALLDEKIADYETAEAGVADDRRYPPLDNVGRLR